MNLKSIIDNMPQNLSQMEKARYIYINLCKQVSYDPKFLIANTLGEKQELFDEDVQIESWTKDKVICSTISRLYVRLLEKTGINAKTIHNKDGEYLGHVFVSFENEGKNYYADPTHDILKAKTGLKTKCFGTLPYSEQEVTKDGSKHKKYNFSTISEDELKKMDDLLGYTCSGLYMEDAIELLRKEMQETDMSIEDKIKFISKTFNTTNLDAMDKSSYFSKILRECTTLEEQEQYNYESLKCTENMEDLRIFAVITNKETGKKNIYTFSNEEFALPVDEKYIEDKILLGMTTVSNRKENKDFLIELSQSKNFKEKNMEIKDNIISMQSATKNALINENIRLEELNKADRIKENEIEIDSNHEIQSL